ncbi:MAG: flippase [Anaerovoracaceae bacterium]
MLENRVFRNASWIIMCKIVQSLLSLIVTMLTARYLGPSNYGLINYAAAIVAFVAPITQLGLGSIQVQELVNYPEEEGKINGTALIMSLMSAVVCSISVVAFSVIANKGETETIIVCTLYTVVLFFQGAELMQYWYQVKYISKYSAIVSLIAFLIITIYKVVLLVRGKGVYWFAIANSIDYIIITFALIVIYHNFGGRKLEFSLKIGKRMLSKSKYYIIANMMVVIFSQTDRIMLKQMLDSTSTGLYSAAVTCAGLANFVYIAIIDSFRPMIFESHNKSKGLFEKNIANLYCIIIYLSLAECIIVTIFSKLIIRIVYGPEYMVASTTLIIVAWYTIFAYIGSVRNVWILANEKQKWIWRINLAGAIANVIINFILIPIWGINGAAVASLATQVFANIIVSYLIKDIRESSYLMLEGIKFKSIISIVKSMRA